jgi:hypothetical protein
MVDWARAERLYREGELSIREIARPAQTAAAQSSGTRVSAERGFSLSEENTGFLTETPTGFLTDSGSEEAEPAETPTGFLTESWSEEAEPAETPTGFAIHHAADAGSHLSFVLPIESSRRCRVS